MAGKLEAATPKVFVCASAWLGVGKKRGAEGKTREGGENRKKQETRSHNKTQPKPTSNTTYSKKREQE